MLQKFIPRLKDRLDQEYNKIVAHVVKGELKDFGQYKYYTGQISGIELAVKMVNEVYQYILLETEGRTDDDNNLKIGYGTSRYPGERSLSDPTSNSDKPFQLY